MTYGSKAVAVALIAIPMVGCNVESSTNAPVGESQEAIKQCPGDPPPPLACWDVICTGPLSDPEWDYVQRPLGTACQGNGECDSTGSCLHTPGTPTLQLGGVSTNSITLRWNAIPGANSYAIFANPGSAYYGASGTSFTWLGLFPATNVCFTVESENYFFLSPPSNTVCATTLTATPTPTWVRTSTSSCADQCGTPSCGCIQDLCASSNPAGQSCSPANDSCDVISGPSFIEYTCE